MKIRYQPRGVCARAIEIELDNGIIQSIRMDGGCNGNLQGVARLAEKRTPNEVIALLKGICCGMKSTSCPDQLAKALMSIPESR